MVEQIESYKYIVPLFQIWLTYVVIHVEDALDTLNVLRYKLSDSYWIEYAVDGISFSVYSSYSKLYISWAA